MHSSSGSASANDAHRSAMNELVYRIQSLTLVFSRKLIPPSLNTLWTKFSTAGCVDIMMGSAMTEDLTDGYIVSPGYPMVLTEAMRVRCQLRKISNNPM